MGKEVKVLSDDEIEALVSEKSGLMPASGMGDKKQQKELKKFKNS